MLQNFVLYTNHVISFIEKYISFKLTLHHTNLLHFNGTRSSSIYGHIGFILCPMLIDLVIFVQQSPEERTGTFQSDTIYFWFK